MKAINVTYEALSPQEPKNKAKKPFFAVPNYILNRDESLIYNFQKTKSEKILNEILLKYKKFIWKKAHKYKGYLNYSRNFELNDLVSESTIAFINSLSKFQLGKGFRLSSFATSYIDGHLKDFILDNIFTTKISKTAEFKKLFFKINEIKKFLNIDGDIVHQDDVKKVSFIINGSLKMTKIILNFIQNFDLIYDEQTEDHGDEVSACSKSVTEIFKINNDTLNSSQTSLISSNLCRFQKEQIKIALIKLKKIDSRQRDIINSRFLDSKIKLDDLAKLYKITPQRVSSIEKQALINLRKIFLENNLQPVEFF